MFKIAKLLLNLIMIFFGLVSFTLADNYLENLKQNQKVKGFTVVSRYNDNADRAIGVRLISDRHGFVIDLMQMQTVPQAFLWVKTLPKSSRGEAHACEHLLLGKGNRGRYFSALKDMALVNSSAYTSQKWTCYHFNTIAGIEAFYQVFEAQLQAFLHPDFNDEEIKREICHLGVKVDPKDASLSLEEKGTVYTEMVSAFEKPYYYTWPKIIELAYGQEHPFVKVSGGNPDMMRSMTPKDLWDFHKQAYQLNNMGVIISIPNNVSISDFLDKIGKLLDENSKALNSTDYIGISKFDIPPATPADSGTVLLSTYPSNRVEDPGYMLYGWPGNLEIDNLELFMLEMFFSAFANGSTSNLYDLFINSQTRVMDIGCNAVQGGVLYDEGTGIYMGLTGVNSSSVNKNMLEKAGNIIIKDIKKIYKLADNSEELKLFNERVNSCLIAYKKNIEDFVNSPPRFGFRGGRNHWLRCLSLLEKESGFCKSLVLKEKFQHAETLLNSGENIWKKIIKKSRLLDIKPYAVGVKPDSKILQQKAQARKARLLKHVEDLKKQYGINDEQKALSRYKKAFDLKTVELEQLKSKSKLPDFIDTPPLTLDDQLEYKNIKLSDNIPLVAATFENMIAAKIGIALRMDVVPESLMVYLPLLPYFLTEIGVIENQQVVPFKEMQERIKREILDLSAYYDSNFMTKRLELVLSGQASNTEELTKLMNWLDLTLFNSYLNVDNLPRIMDMVDQSLVSYAQMLKASEENWVKYIFQGYQRQKNPLFMSLNCFLTARHHVQRLKWLLTDPGKPKEQAEIKTFMKALLDLGVNQERDYLNKLLAYIQDPKQDVSFEIPDSLKKIMANSESEIISEVAKQFKFTLNDIPDSNLKADWKYLCEQTMQDILTLPETVIANIHQVLKLICRSDNVRMFMISNSQDREKVLPKINNFIKKLDNKNTSTPQKYRPIERVVERLRDRHAKVNPNYVGLVHTETQNGLLMFNARQADSYDVNEKAIYKCLAGQLYAGAGPHGLFMKTWEAGLAYSNGYRFGPSQGRCTYYAERCPDVSKTMEFVVKEIKKVKYDKALDNYAIAQIFLESRAAESYEQRGVAIAADLADGLTPEVIKNYRKKILKLKKRKDFSERIWSYMEEAYGPVLIGYGQPLAKSKEGVFFILGPEHQFEKLEKYIASVEEEQPVYRLYPRDFWLIQDVAK